MLSHSQSRNFSLNQPAGAPSVARSTRTLLSRVFLFAALLALAGLAVGASLLGVEAQAQGPAKNRLVIGMSLALIMQGAGAASVDRAMSKG